MEGIADATRLAAYNTRAKLQRFSARSLLNYGAVAQIYDLNLQAEIHVVARIFKQALSMADTRVIRVYEIGVHGLALLFVAFIFLQKRKKQRQNMHCAIVKLFYLHKAKATDLWLLL